MTKYRCLVLDHDDTAVQSTPTVHYPSFMDTLNTLRPEARLSLEDYILYTFTPGFEALCYDILGFTKAEMQFQLENWARHVERASPPFHPGMRELIARQRAEGGLVCVVSHSYARFVLRDYTAAGIPAPDRVFGWELGPERLKPHPWPLEQLMREYALSPREVLMVDDLKPGFDMARAAGCDCAAALWAYDLPRVRAYMRAQCPGGLESVRALEQLLFGEA